MSSSDFSAFALFTAGLAAFAPVVSALVVPGGSNPTAGAVTAPDSTSSVTAGKSFKVQWNSTDSAICGDKVDLVLLYGPSPAQMAAQDYIVQGIANSGSYEWTPSTSLKASDDTNKYGIELICESTKAYQYTTRFQIANENPTSSSSSASGYASGSTSSHSATSSASSASSSAASSVGPKYPTGNSTTTAAGTTGAASITASASATASGHHSSYTGSGSGSGSKTSSTGSSSTASSTTSSASASSSGNAAEHLKVGFGGLLAAAAVAALAL